MLSYTGHWPVSANQLMFREREKQSRKAGPVGVDEIMGCVLFSLQARIHLENRRNHSIPQSAPGEHRKPIQPLFLLGADSSIYSR